MALLDSAYSPELVGLAEVISQVMHTIGVSCAFVEDPTTVDRWWASPWAFDEAVRGAMFVLEACRPKGEIVRIEFPAKADDPHGAGPALLCALTKIQTVLNSPSRESEELRARLGGLVDQIKANLENKRGESL